VHPSPLAVPRKPIPRVQVRGGLARPVVYLCRCIWELGDAAPRFVAKSSQGGVSRGFLVVIVVKVLEALAPVRFSPGSP